LGFICLADFDFINEWAKKFEMQTETHPSKALK